MKRSLSYGRRSMHHVKVIIGCQMLRFEAILNRGEKLLLLRILLILKQILLLILLVRIPTHFSRYIIVDM